MSNSFEPDFAVIQARQIEPIPTESTLDTGPPEPSFRVRFWDSPEEVLRDLDLAGLQGLAGQLNRLIEMDRAGDLDDEPIDFDSMKLAAALALREELHLEDAQWVVDRQGQVGFEIDRAGALFLAIVVMSVNQQVVYVVDDRSRSDCDDHRIKGKGHIDNVVEVVGKFLSGMTR